MRAAVRHVTLPEDAPHAYNLNDNIVIFGDLGLGSFMHEIGHSVDSHANDGTWPGVKDRAANTAEWVAAYDASQAVTDDSARSSQIENFAQITVHTIFDLNVPGGLATLGNDANGTPIFHQYKPMLDIQKKYLS
jgi:hypothetical protein